MKNMFLNWSKMSFSGQYKPQLLRKYTANEYMKLTCHVRQQNKYQSANRLMGFLLPDGLLSFQSQTNILHESTLLTIQSKKKTKCNFISLNNVLCPVYHGWLCLDIVQKWQTVDLKISVPISWIWRTRNWLHTRCFLIAGDRVIVW